MGSYHLVLVTRKNRWVEITGKKRMVAVLDVSKWKTIQDRRAICSSDVQWCKDVLQDAFPKSHLKFKRMVLNGEVREAGSAVEAYEGAYAWVAELEASGRTANVHCDGIECHVYAMRMKPTAWNVGRFARRNEHIPESSRSSASCFYVGQTGLSTVEERFNRHIGHGRDKMVWGRHHFLTPFAMAHDNGVRELIAEYDLDAGVPMSMMPNGRALIQEAGFAKWLQERGHAVIFG